MKKNKKSYLVFLLICLSAVCLRSYYLVDADKQKPLGLLSWDMFGYYLYLPSTFIYHDIGLENKEWTDNLFKKYDPSDYFYQVADGIDGKKINIYGMGTAAVYAPGFFCARLASKIFGYADDGYSLPFELSVLITFLLVFVLNIFLLRKLLLKFFNDRVTAVILLLVVVGTNYFYQCGYGGYLPHNFIVTLLSAILLLTMQWHENPSLKNSVWLSSCLALAILIRPPAVLFVLIPLLWNVTSVQSLNEKLLLLKNNSQKIALMIGLIFLAGVPQLIYFKYTSGQWLSFNRGETMDWWHAHLSDFLFSYKKGWLLYTPVMLLAFAGMIFLLRQHKKLFYPTLLILVLQVWMLSAWDAWWFHTSYSQRGMVDIYSLLALPIGCLVNAVFISQFSFIKFIFFPVASFFIFLSAFQTWQYMNRVLHWDRETKTYYWKTFLKTYVSEEDKKYLEVNRKAEDDSAFISTLSSDYRLLKENKFEFNNVGKNTTVINSEGFFYLDSSIDYSPELVNEEWKRLTEKDHLFIHVEAELLTEDSLTEPSVLLTAKTESGSTVMHHKTVSLTPVRGILQTVSLNYITPLLRHNDDKVVVFLWNQKHKNYLINKMSVRIYEPRHDWNK